MTRVADVISSRPIKIDNVSQTQVAMKAGNVDISATAAKILNESKTSATPALTAQKLLRAETQAMSGDATQIKTIMDATERLVAAGLRDSGALNANGATRNAVDEGAARGQFEKVLTAAPVVPNTSKLTTEQKFDVYGSVVEIHGDRVARSNLAAAAENGRPTMVALRTETSTLANRGRGEYDDRMVVLSRNKDGTAKVLELQGNTEPSAQYDWRAGDKNTGRAASPGYERVEARYTKTGQRKVDGQLFNNDKILDMGRLATGTYHYKEKPGGFLGARAFDTGTDQKAMRDVNGDGKFTAADVNSKGEVVQVGRFHMYIHRGGPDNTWSAGCQTIPMSDYPKFLEAIGKNANFSYVLINAR